MTEHRLERFLLYSFLIHTTLILSLLVSNLTKEKTKNYYSIDFYGGGPSIPSGQAPRIEEQAPKKEPVKTKIINPREDLLIKSNVPAIPIPKPQARREEGSAAIPSAIPSAADSSGVGVGFGPDGYRGGGSGAGNFPYQWYVQVIKKKLDANWNVTEGFSRRIYAQTAFTINRDGSLTDIEIEETSNNELFDRSARRAVELSGPFPPLPHDFPENSLRVHVRFTVKR